MHGYVNDNIGNLLVSLAGWLGTVVLEKVRNVSARVKQITVTPSTHQLPLARLSEAVKIADPT